MPLFCEETLLSPVLFLAALVFCAFFGRKRLGPLQFNTSGVPYPPGPKPKLFIGNAHEVPTDRPWFTYTDWAKIYGSVFYIKVYSQHFVIVNSLEDAIEMFEKRSTIYSDRPDTAMFKLTGWDFATSLLPYGDVWRYHRRIFQQNFKRNVMTRYQPVQIQKVHEMLRSLLVTPEEFMAHYRTVAAAIIMATMYGYDISPSNDYFVSLAEGAVRKISQSIFPGASIVNAIPMLRYLPSWFPGARFKRFAKECKVSTYNMQNLPYNFVRKNMTRGITNGLLAELLGRNDALGGSEQIEDILKGVVATSYAAGADTTVSAIGTFFLAMTCSPQVQKKAQEEIDRVIGSHRLPNYDDRSALPYVEALYREIMRWRPVLPLGGQHATSKDDIYKGYFIPKGTTVIPNTWAMAHDETIYTMPELFMPERYFDADGNLNDDDTILAFGFGRRYRVCAGRHMASATLWLIIVSTLSTFDITKAKNASGQEIPVSADYSNDATSHPLPYQCSITPRSEQATKLILETT